MSLYQAALNYVSRYATSEENLRRVLWRKVRRDAAKNDEQLGDTAAIEREIDEIVARVVKLGASRRRCLCGHAGAVTARQRNLCPCHPGTPGRERRRQRKHPGSNGVERYRGR